MTTHKTGTREQWLKTRLNLLKAEKELTRRSDELARQRQELPWVTVNKGYRFETDEGSASLSDFFRGRSQFLVYHFMLGPHSPGYMHVPNCASTVPIGKLGRCRRRNIGVRGKFERLNHVFVEGMAA